MCELLGLSSNLPATLRLSLQRLAGHAAPPTSMRDGWGIAYYEDTDVRLIKDAEPANDSDWLRFVSQHDLRSPIVMAHIRKATVGALSYRNAQPFVREMAGRMHCFAHNGWLPGLLETPAFQSTRFSPVGETDSEQAFCALLEDLGALWVQAGEIPPLEARLNIVTAFAARLRQFGPANFLYSDGDALFAHGDRRKSPTTGEVVAPGLVYLLRECPPSGATITANGLSVTAADQAVALVASVPLSAERWQEMTEGEVTVFRAGRIADRRVAGPA
ncbi:class II glutamine amidotransferase [Thiohalophilus sp.]|uniref:class II glutamine amidotransferase n=1 Tax=Thiohalophilus sp. TaxID=3028392 RepID=UPI002ACE8901|nr:class II glutamine amidotransferase [Thiohalophilus sp.]MDZ7803141.1 class II glutamine amidotransferase [Thiohalophilus sp.]